MRSGEPLRVDDVRADPAYRDCRAMDELGVAADLAEWARAEILAEPRRRRL